MAEATIVPPAAPPSAPKPGAPSAFPASTGEIRVTAPTPTSSGLEPVADSARGRMRQALADKVAGKKPAPAAASAQPAEKPAPSKTAPTPAAADPGTTAAPGSEPSQPGGEPAASDPAAGKSPDGKKPSPWKLVEDYKGRLAKAETELAEARKAVVPEQERKTFEEKMTKLEARNKELEQHLSYIDYSKTEEFKSKYVAPYEKAWNNAMSELRELTVSDPQTGESRAVTSQDMLAIVNAPLGTARQLAKEAFGDFADDVMAHRKAIRDLFDAQNTALEDAKKNGADRIKQAQEEFQKQQNAIRESVTQMWKSENESALKDERFSKFFTPHEGDEQWNQRLQKGYELVDKAWSENPADPKLSPEDRAKVIRRHAAVRNRAASWGALRGQVESLQGQIASLQKELEQYKGSDPGTGGNGRSTNPAAEPGTGKGIDRLRENLRKIAK